MVAPSAEELLVQATSAEQRGDRSAAVTRLRAYLNLRPDAGQVRLHLAKLLMEMAEPMSAREVLEPLDSRPTASESAELRENKGGHSPSPRAVGERGIAKARTARTPEEWRRQANRLLALLDDQTGALSSARIRWERALADDIDDGAALARIRELEGNERVDRPTATLSVGTLVAPEGVRVSRFRIVRELGRGASAAVYLVHDARLNIPLALKVLHPQLAAANRADARERFFAEARLAMRLRHPGVVAIYDVDEAARCLAMEYIAGGTVRDRLRPTHHAERLRAAEIAATARSLLAALAHVHEAGIVHGDLKPGNVLLREPTEAVLADFGVAALATELSAIAGERGGGTPLYLAPEQFRGATPSAAADLFAAGAILFELWRGHPLRRQSDLLSGRYVPTFDRETLTRGDPDPQEAGRLAALISALLAATPAARPPDARAALAILSA